MSFTIKSAFSIKYSEGDKIGNNITIIKFDHRGEGHNYYKCKCSCRNEFYAREKELDNGIVTSCGHDKEYKLKDDLTGRDFGELHVIKFSFMSSDSIAHYLCKCSCGNITIVRRKSLIDGLTTSCGCVSQKLRLERTPTHNMSGTRFYKIWIHVRRRCNDINDDAYIYYGGRGITYDPRWESFENFYDDMYESYCEHVVQYGEKNTTLDRIDVNGNYCKKNCRWATVAEQLRNKRDNIYVQIGSNKYCLMDAFNLFGNKTLLYGTVRDRISKYNIDPLTALLLPIDYKSVHGERKEILKNSMGDLVCPIKLICGKRTDKYVKLLDKLHNESFW